MRVGTIHLARSKAKNQRAFSQDPGKHNGESTLTGQLKVEQPNIQPICTTKDTCEQHITVDKLNSTINGSRTFTTHFPCSTLSSIFHNHHSHLSLSKHNTFTNMEKTTLQHKHQPNNVHRQTSQTSFHHIRQTRHSTKKDIRWRNLQRNVRTRTYQKKKT